MRKIYFFIFLLTITMLFTGCSNTTQIPPSNTDHSPSEEKEADGANVGVLTVEEAADKVIELVSKKDFVALEQFVHPSKGLRFTPYGYINVEEDQVFTAAEVKTLWEDEQNYLWGYFDGTGDPIELTFQEYYERFVYDADYVNAEEKSVNKRLGQGNSLDNSKEVYPNATVVEYHFPGFDEQYEGMDWKSLRLVLEKEGDKWYLVGIIHDQWTI